jgi:ubiquinone/menaquinone biosynthesis C-methylase UbiE
MQETAARDFRCPACASELKLATFTAPGSDIDIGELQCGCGSTWTIEDGIPDFTYPKELHPSDTEFRQKYDQTADDYDGGLRWLFASFFESEDAVRSKMVDLLDLQPGQRVLEIGCGTGKDSCHIVQRLGPSGQLYALEISRGMLELAKKRLGSGTPLVEYLLANASYLPFPSATFDAVFHFGALNTFGDKRRALSEMARVVRPGGKVVVGDEGVAPWLRSKLYGRVLRNANPLYNHQPPLGMLPGTAQEVCLRWILGNAFYVVDFRVGVGAPTVDLDLAIPGKRGGTLRSRYYGERPDKA